MVRREATAAASLALILARRRLGMAMAAMIKIIATTINNSIREKPFCLEGVSCFLIGSPPQLVLQLTIIHTPPNRPSSGLSGGSASAEMLLAGQTFAAAPLYERGQFCFLQEN